MNGQPESQQLQNFHERLSDWVSSQGFWFQLRYSMSGAGQKGAFTFHLLKLSVRVLVFLLIAAVAVWIFLVKQTGTAGYAEKLKDGIQEKFLAEEIELKGFQVDKGEFYISRMAMTGGAKTFFTSMEVKNLKCRKGLLDQFKKEWDSGLIEISWASLGLRAGADSEEDAESMGDVIFQDLDKLNFTGIDVDDMSLQWGYSERTRGEIKGSRMKAQRLKNAWRLRFTGGTFSQNWLKRLEIVELEVVFGRQGIVFEKGVFKRGKGYVTLVDTKVKAGERPEVSGTVNLRKMEIAALVPVAARSFVEGTISGNFDISGSTNSTEGVGFEGDVDLAGEDVITVRDRVHLLRALSVVDVFNNYRKLDFRDGSFHLKSRGGNLEVTNVVLKAGDLLSMRGEMTVRLPTEPELDAFTDRGAEEGILNEDELGMRPDVTLRGAAKNNSRIGFDKGSDDESLFDRLGINVENRRLEGVAAEQIARAYRYEGSFVVSLPENAFARAPKLAEMFPVDPATDRIPMQVPLGGQVLFDLTLDQADALYKAGTR